MTEYHVRLEPLIAFCETMIALDRTKVMDGTARIRRWKERIAQYRFLLNKEQEKTRPPPLSVTTFGSLRPIPDAPMRRTDLKGRKA